MTTNQVGPCALGRLWNSIQSWLFPMLEDEIGELDDKHRHFVAVCELCAPQDHVRDYQWIGNGSPPKSRLALTTPRKSARCPRASATWLSSTTTRVGAKNASLRRRKPYEERERSAAERVNGHLHDEHGRRHVRVRSPVKVAAHLAFGLLAIAAEQMFRLLVCARAGLSRRHEKPAR